MSELRRGIRGLFTSELTRINSFRSTSPHSGSADWFRRDRWPPKSDGDIAYLHCTSTHPGALPTNWLVSLWQAMGSR
jgi:hypothetical protein